MRDQMTSEAALRGEGRRRCRHLQAGGVTQRPHLRDVRPAGEICASAPTARAPWRAHHNRRRVAALRGRHDIPSSRLPLRRRRAGYEDRMEKVFIKLGALPAADDCGDPGICTGGAAVIAAACDLRIATRNLKFGFPSPRTLANMLSAPTSPRVAALTGVGRRRRHGHDHRADGCGGGAGRGLVNELFDTAGSLMRPRARVGPQLATQAPLTMARRPRRSCAVCASARRHRRQGPDRALLRSADFQEGLDGLPHQAHPEVRRALVNAWYTRLRVIWRLAQPNLPGRRHEDDAQLLLGSTQKYVP